MDLVSKFFPNAIEHSQRNRFHEEEMLRGIVRKRFPANDTVQLQLGHLEVVAKLEAELVVGKTYWFRVLERGYLPVLQKAAEGQSLEKLLEAWAIRPSKKTVQVLALFDHLHIPIQKVAFLAVLTTQKRAKATLDELKQALKLLHEKGLYITPERVNAALVETKADESLSCALKRLYDYGKRGNDCLLVQALDMYFKQEKELLESGVEKGFLLKGVMIELRQIFALLERNKLIEAEQSEFLEAIQARLSLQLEHPRIPHEIKQLVFPLFHTNWTLQYECNEAQEVKGSTMNALISVNLPSLGKLLVHIREKDKRIFASIYSERPAPSAFKGAQNELEKRLKSIGYKLETCTWVLHTEKQLNATSKKGGVDIRI